MNRSYAIFNLYQLVCVSLPHRWGTTVSVNRHYKLAWLPTSHNMSQGDLYSHHVGHKMSQEPLQPHLFYIDHRCTALCSTGHFECRRRFPSDSEHRGTCDSTFLQKSRSSSTSSSSQHEACVYNLFRTCCLQDLFILSWFKWYTDPFFLNQLPYTRERRAATDYRLKRVGSFHRQIYFSRMSLHLMLVLAWLWEHETDLLGRAGWTSLHRKNVPASLPSLYTLNCV